MSRFPAVLRVFCLAFIAYAVSAQVWAHPISLAPHYVYLAQSLLHGHTDLIQLPPVTYDLLHFNGRWFVAGSPMPSILMLPFVAIFGVGFSDVLFSVVLGAIDVALVYALLGVFVGRRTAEASVIARSAKDDEAISTTADEIAARPAGARNDANPAISESARCWITLLFALGTPFWYLASLGTYWFTAHLVVVFFALLATREALTRQHWFLVGLWLAGAGFARPTALFLAPFFLIIMFYARHAMQQQRTAYPILRNVALFGTALALGLGAHFAYNHARFKSFTDFGYAYVTGADNITSVYARYGGFNLRFLPCNLAVSLLSPPEVNGAVPAFITQACAYLLEGVNLSDASAPITPNPLGMSIFLVTPALLIVFLSLRPSEWNHLHCNRRRFGAVHVAPLASRRLSVHLRGRGISEPVGAGRRSAEESSRRGFQPPAPIILAAWVGLLTTLIPLWLYHNTGSLQFGWRYLLDAAPMWIILLAAGMQKVTRLKQGLILASIAINLWGFLWMFEKLNG